MLDAEWRYVFQTDELRRTFAAMGWELTMLGVHYFSREAHERLVASVGGWWAEREHYRAWFLELGPYALAGTPGGRDELRRVVSPELADLVDGLQPRDAPSTWIVRPEWTTAGADVAGAAVWLRIDDGQGGHRRRFHHSPAGRKEGRGARTSPAVG